MKLRPGRLAAIILNNGRLQSIIIMRLMEVLCPQVMLTPIEYHGLFSFGPMLKWKTLPRSTILIGASGKLIISFLIPIQEYALFRPRFIFAVPIVRMPNGRATNIGGLVEVMFLTGAR